MLSFVTNKMKSEIKQILYTLYRCKITKRYKKMANVAMDLGNYLCTKYEISYYTRQSIIWNQKYEDNLEQLEKQTNYEQKHVEAYDKCYYAEDGKEVKIGGRVYAHSNECEAIAYADKKVHQYDEDLAIELAALDVDYEAMKNMMDTKLQVLRAREESEKNNLGDSTQDTCLIGQ